LPLTPKLGKKGRFAKVSGSILSLLLGDWMFKNIIRHFILKIGVLLHGLEDTIAIKTLPEFGNAPVNVRIDLPRRIVNPHKMFLGENIYLGPGTLLIALTHYPTASMRGLGNSEIKQRFDPKIVIGNRVTSTGGLQIAAHDQITIEDDVLFATNIHINDGSHGFDNANTPYKYQPIFRISPITIKRGSWIGQNVVILSGVTIGENAIIGANSVVNNDVPDRCIAVGNPAKVIKRWDPARQKWVRL